METTKSNGIVWCGLLVALGIAVAGFFVKSAIDGFKDKERIVTVKGLAEKEVPADRVIWPLVYKEVGNDLATVYNSIDQKNKTIQSFLISKGIPEAEITVSAPEIVDMQAERYVDNVRFRYNATAVVTVASDKVDLVRKLIGEQTELIKQGIALSGGDYRFSTQYMFTKLNEIKPEMIEEATKNARTSAQKFAEDSDSKLGKIRTANQGQFSISDRDANTPYIKNVRVVTTVDYYLKD